MKLIPVDYSTVEKKTFASTKLLELFEEFEKLNVNCVCLEDHGYKNTSTATSAINTSAKRFNRSHLKAFARENKVYLVNLIKVGKL